mgnify:CR=1 FL=1
MKKIALLVNLFSTLLFSFSTNTNIEKQETKIQARLLEDTSCDYQDSLVTITTASNLMQASGVIIEEDSNYVYIATSYENYDKAYHYEVVFNDYSREKAEIVGSFLRMGVGDNVVDNAHAGGVFAQINIKNGLVESDGINTDGNKYKTHPDSGIELIGYKIPKWKDICEM